MGALLDLMDRLKLERATCVPFERSTNVADLKSVFVAPVLSVPFVTQQESIPEEHSSQAHIVLWDLALLPDDRRYIEALLEGVSPAKKLDLLDGYRTRWLDASNQEGKLHAKENAGRFAANTWLRKVIESPDVVADRTQFC